jgi:glycosyltransferase involved in cell wall biosynthesis
MIIVNDGSTDNTSEIVRAYIENDPRVKLYDQKNIGIFRLSETYNFALKEATGEYVAILEGDDLWEDDKLQRQVDKMESDQSIVLSWGKAYSVQAASGDILGLHPENHSEFFFNKPIGSILNLLYLENCIPALTIMIRKSVIDEIGGFQQGFNLPLVDLPTLLKISLLGEFFYDNEPLGKWRIYANQVTKTFPIEIIKGRYAAAISHLNDLPLKYSSQLKITERDMHKYFKKRIMTGYAMSGRYKLMRKDFRNARKDYFKSLFFIGVFEPVWRLRAIIGLTCSFFHYDVEGIAKLMGKKSYKNV